MGEGEMWGWGEFKPGTLNSKPLVYFPHELTPGPSLLRKEGCLCENLHLYFPIHQLSVAVLIDPNAEFESGTFNFQLSTWNLTLEPRTECCEVNPSGVVPVVGRYFPGAIPGLLDDDTSGVSNPDTTPGFSVVPVSQVTILQ